MFTGIIETVARAVSIEEADGNRVFWFESELAPQLKPDQSVAHDGVCLTVEEVRGNAYRVTAIAETLAKTTLGGWQAGQRVNLERSATLGKMLDGHLVQGHVDTVGTVEKMQDLGGSRQFAFRFDAAFSALVVEKGSIAVNGTSLTVFNVGTDRFEVAVIPYTLQHTTLGELQPGQRVNLEFDIIGKYVQRQMKVQGQMAR